MKKINKKTKSRASSVYLEPARQELVLDLQEVSSAHLPFEGLVEDGEPHVVLHVLPPSVAVSGRRAESRSSTYNNAGRGAPW